MILRRTSSVSRGENGTSLVAPAISGAFARRRGARTPACRLVTTCIKKLARGTRRQISAIWAEPARTSPAEPHDPTSPSANSWNIDRQKRKRGRQENVARGRQDATNDESHAERDADTAPFGYGRQLRPMPGIPARPSPKSGPPSASPWRTGRSSILQGAITMHTNSFAATYAAASSRQQVALRARRKNPRRSLRLSRSSCRCFKSG